MRGERTGQEFGQAAMYVLSFISSGTDVSSTLRGWMSPPPATDCFGARNNACFIICLAWTRMGHHVRSTIFSMFSGCEYKETIHIAIDEHTI
jgi:hypothetical protein